MLLCPKSALPQHQTTQLATCPRRSCRSALRLDHQTARIRFELIKVNSSPISIQKSMNVDGMPRDRQLNRVDSIYDNSGFGHSRSIHEHLQRKITFQSVLLDPADPLHKPDGINAAPSRLPTGQQQTEHHVLQPQQSSKPTELEVARKIDRNHRRVLETLLPTVLLEVMPYPTLFVNITNCIYWSVNDFMDNCIKATLTKLGVVLGVEDRKEELLDILLQFPNNLGNPEPDDLSRISRKVQASVAEIVSSGRAALTRCEARCSDQSETCERADHGQPNRPRRADHLHLRGPVPTEIQNRLLHFSDISEAQDQLLLHVVR